LQGNVVSMDAISHSEISIFAIYVTRTKVNLDATNAASNL
jgi:hypothetical protein